MAWVGSWRAAVVRPRRAVLLHRLLRRRRLMCTFPRFWNEAIELAVPMATRGRHPKCIFAAAVADGGVVVRPGIFGLIKTEGIQ